MAKRKAAAKPKNTRQRYLLAGVGSLVLVALGFLLFRIPPAAAVTHISPSDYQTRYVANTTPHLLLDVRTPEEFAAGHIHGAVNIPVEVLASRLNDVSDSLPIVVYCRSGNRSAQAADILADAGYTDIADLGGLTTWTAQGFPVE